MTRSSHFQTKYTIKASKGKFKSARPTIRKANLRPLENNSWTSLVLPGIEHPKADAEQGRIQGNKTMWCESKSRWPTKVQSRYSNFWALYMSSATLKTVEKNKHVKHETWHFRTKTRLVKSKDRLFCYCGLFNFTWWLLLNSYPKSKSN